jgi:hypothetical protein
MAEFIRLDGNSKVSEPLTDKNTGEILSFEIANPNGSKLHVDMTRYIAVSHFWLASKPTSELRQDVYDAYKYLTENIPATTPLLEDIASEFPMGVLHEKADQMGAYNNSPGKNSSNASSPIDTPAVVIGNINLPKLNGFEQPARQYHGVDGKWYVNSDAEVLMHELAHSSKKLQNWTPEGIKQYDLDIALKVTPENERRAMEFVNATMRAPSGKMLEDTSTYFEKRPESLPTNTASELDVDKLLLGNIPKEFAGYSSPSLVGSDQNTHQMRDLKKLAQEFRDADLNSEAGRTEFLNNHKQNLNQVNAAVESYATVFNALNKNGLNENEIDTLKLSKNWLSELIEKDRLSDLKPIGKPETQSNIDSIDSIGLVKNARAIATNEDLNEAQKSAHYAELANKYNLNQVNNQTSLEH